jgi:hypothetical protein
VGGFVGYDWDGEINHCFWDIQTSRINRSDGGYGLATAHMQAAAIFIEAGWDFENTWMICEGKDYPRLQWENVQCEE